LPEGAGRCAKPERRGQAQCAPSADVSLLINLNPLVEIIMSFSDNKLTVRSSADLVAAVPYLIGFHPGDGSLVVIACRDSRVVFAARGDLPAPGSPASQLREFTDHWSRSWGGSSRSATS
jgi:hypothetical protein